MFSFVFSSLLLHRIRSIGATRTSAFLQLPQEIRLVGCCPSPNCRFRCKFRTELVTLLAFSPDVPFTFPKRKVPALLLRRLDSRNCEIREEEKGKNPLQRRLIYLHTPLAQPRSLSCRNSHLRSFVRPWSYFIPSLSLPYTMRVNSSLIYTLLALATTVAAQDGTTAQTTATAATTTTTAALPTLGGETTSSRSEEASTTAAAETTTRVTITGGTPVTATAAVPTLGSTSTAKKLPSLTGTSGLAIPVVTVPPTSNAPFMQKSTLPEGTVFIAVGSALAFFALAVIAWRGLVAWSLHRSVRKAASNVHLSDSKSKSHLRPPPSGSGGFYSTGPGSQLSLDHIATSPRTANRPNSHQMTSNHSLFFSPTAGGGAAGDRRSAYLPAGYYASGQRDSLIMGQANGSHTHLHSQSISSTRYGGGGGRGNSGVSPPGSPLMGPQGMAVRAGASTASLSLPPTGRAPSTYLEDLFESHREGGGRGF